MFVTTSWISAKHLQLISSLSQAANPSTHSPKGKCLTLTNEVIAVVYFHVQSIKADCHKKKKIYRPED
jgi:hypothetical protein